MKKFSLPLFFIFLSTYLLAQSDIPICNPEVTKIKFTEKSLFTIDGDVQDWETILGKGTGNPEWPYKPLLSSGFNWSVDNDIQDHPDNKSDLRFFSFTHDDYNVYFYFRLAHKSNDSNTFYYFIDINANGFMNAGEPVISATFTNRMVTSLSLGKFIPNDIYLTLLEGSPMKSPIACKIDGYSIKGSVQEVFNSSSIPVQYKLDVNQEFSVALVDNGKGIEFAIPWEYLRNWQTNTVPLNPGDIFTYQVSLQSGEGPYDPNLVSDHAGGCNGDLAVSGNVEALLQTSAVEKLTDNSFRIKLSYFNPLNIEEFISIPEISLSNVQQFPGSSITPSQVLIQVYTDNNCNGVVDGFERAFQYFTIDGSFAGQQLTFNGPVDFLIPGNGTACFIIDISYPPNTIKTADIEITPTVATWFDACLPCEPESDLACGIILGDGGKPINPIGFRIGSFEVITFLNHNRNGEDVSKQKEKTVKEALVYPNPSKGSVKIAFPSNKGLVDVYLTDFLGRVIQRQKRISEQIIELQNLKPGTYSVQINFEENGKTIIKKIVVF